MESSLSFTDGDRYSSVSWYYDELVISSYLAEFQEHIERRLDERANRQCDVLRQAGEPSRQDRLFGRRSLAVERSVSNVKALDAVTWYALT